MHTWIDRRTSAVLLHITSLPGPFHKGVLGEEARCFIQRLAQAGFSIWQFLPLGPTHEHGSPYESLSSFAGNPELIDLRDCVQHGWLHEKDVVRCTTAEQHQQLRQQAATIFWQQLATDHALKTSLEQFCQQHAWLDDFACFSALKQAFQGKAWWQWPDNLRDRQPEAVASARQQHQDAIRQAIFEQYLFEQQWQQLKQYAETSGIALFGDLPIYVAHDSADVWCNRDYFTTNDVGLCEEVAGVPPDYFSTTGQRWGNPLYRWEKMENDHFKWWEQRIARQLERMHMLRIDHFRGLEAYWAIPGESEDGIIGEWRKAPGAALLQTLSKKFGRLPLIAEDLGMITEEVTTLRESFSLPGMKILQFAFGGDEHNPYLPANHEKNSVAYTGTHDNDTTLGWFNNAEPHVREHLLRLLQVNADEMPWALIECALASIANMAVIPMQDLLELDSQARFNTPGTVENNWSWRLDAIPEASCSCWKHALTLNQRHHRTNR